MFPRGISLIYCHSWHLFCSFHNSFTILWSFHVNKLTWSVWCNSLDMTKQTTYFKFFDTLQSYFNINQARQSRIQVILSILESQKTWLYLMKCHFSSLSFIVLNHKLKIKKNLYDIKSWLENTSNIYDNIHRICSIKELYKITNFQS